MTERSIDCLNTGLGFELMGSKTVLPYHHSRSRAVAPDATRMVLV